ncbi:MAG TPA: hypothetical protein VFZ24_00330 [Longimicrobiales bacterium]
MGRTHVLIVSSVPAVSAWLAGRLDHTHYRVHAVEPGPALVEAVRQGHPDVAIIDGIDTQPQSARLAVALLKDSNPGVRIVALSGASSEADGGVIEQGIFCYLANCSREELLRVVEAAAAERGRRPDAEPQGVTFRGRRRTP